jgi:hypothetical protein
MLTALHWPLLQGLTCIEVFQVSLVRGLQSAVTPRLIAAADEALRPDR